MHWQGLFVLTMSTFPAFRGLALKYMLKCKNYMHFKGASNNDYNARAGAKIRKARAV